MSETSPGPGRVVWAALFAALIVSGVAGIINQVVWQRALKIFLGGSETLSSMVVVLVFMLGLGLGAALASRFAEQSKNPLWVLAAVEAGLAMCNALVAVVLGLEISESVYAVQRLAVSVGLPLRAVYAAMSLLVLIVPTMLMGATVPLASEACQRQLDATSSRLVPVLFFVNTVGAAGGAIGASFWLLPYYGQRLALFAAVACNLAASVAIAVAAIKTRAATPADSIPRRAWREGLTREEWYGFVLGFLALGYEMYLFRVLALAHEPLPYTFAIGLCFFLLFWSIGVAVAGRMSDRSVPSVAVVTLLITTAMPFLFHIDRGVLSIDLFLAAILYCLPCVGFGVLYGLFVSRAAKHWGRDVGRYYAFNTIGSCLGILFFTLIGYEIQHDLNAWIIGPCLAAVALYELGSTVSESTSGMRRSVAIAGHLCVVVAVCVLVYGLGVPYTESEGRRTYWGRDGVVEVYPSGEVYIDGLWHTALSNGTNHIGRPYTWVMAMAAVMAHEGRPIEDALVIGAGVGISMVTLAGVEGIHVDGYEINHTLKPLLRDYPDRTLNSTARHNVTWWWRDARTGLALNEKKYDVILSAPLLLRQAGSSLLLSKEYLRLLKSRLKADGVIGIYSNEGIDEQSWLVQRTLAELFEYSTTWYDGVVTIASDHPIPLVTAKSLAARMAHTDRLAAEMRTYARNTATLGGAYALYDQNRKFPYVADRPITDDHPLVEYPGVAHAKVLPVPRASVR